METHSYQALEVILGHHFKDRDLLRRALAHSNSASLDNYERLEFLGDRVLGLVIAESLYRRFPEESEGDLAKRLAALVQADVLAEVAHAHTLERFIELSNAERAAGGAENLNILADVFEAIAGAIYLDGGLQPCQRLIEKAWTQLFEEMVSPPQHPKTALQEWAQDKGLPLPVYAIAAQTGPDHAPVFSVRLSVQGYDDILAEGRSRQAAEKGAALLFLTRLGQTP